jgi:hypothetical protein
LASVVRDSLKARRISTENRPGRAWREPGPIQDPDAVTMTPEAASLPLALSR